MAISHGFNKTEAATSVTAPVTVNSGLQIVVGTAPVNMLDDPEAAVNTPVLVKGRLSVRDEKPPQIMCDSIYPLEQGTAIPETRREPPKEKSVIYLKMPGMDSREFRHISLVMTMFEGDTPLKVRLADTGKMLGTTCLNHPAFLQECREWLGDENVVVRQK